MAYNTRFFFRFESYAGREFRINIKQDGYTGSAVQRPLGASPTLRRDDADNGIRGTSLEIIAECATDNEFATLYTSDARKFYVELVDVSTSAVIWDGFVSPELYAAPEIAPPYDVQITAVDGLGELKRQKFPAGGRKTILAHLQTILGYAGLSAGTSDIIIIDSLHCTTPSVAAAGLLGSITVDLDHLVAEDMNCYDALEAILRTLNLTITRISSKRWLIMRESDVEVQSSAVAAMTAAGSIVSLPVPQYGSMMVSDWWPVGNMANEIEPAKKQLSTALAYAMRDSMLNDGDMEDSSAWTTQLVRFDNGWAKMRGDPINRLPATLSQSINVSQHGGPLHLSIASLHAVARIFPSDSDVKASVEVKLQASGETQYLQKSAGDCLSWTTREKDFSFVTPLSVASSPLWPDRGGVTETTWFIPEIPAAGVLTVTIKLGYSGSQDYSIWIDHIHLLQTAPYGYMDTVVLDNDARGKLDEFIHVFGDSPYTPNALANIRNIVSTSGGTVVEEWATAQFEGELLSVMAMDRALAAALPRLWAKGTIHVPTSAVLPFAMVSPDDLPMIIKRASWKLLEDEIDLDLLSIPAAEVEIDSETITEMTGSEAAAAGGSGSSSGGGSSGSSGGGSGSIYNYFEDVEVDGERVGIKSLHDINIIQEEADEQEGTPEVLKNISEVLRHLSLQVLNPGTVNAKTILVSDITFASMKNLVSGGIDDGGDTPTGGSIATLADVTLSGLATGDTLVYNNTSNHWENKPLLLANLGDVDGTPTNGQTLIYDSISGKWKPGSGGGGGTLSSVGLSMPTGFSVSGSPLTANGTITVSFTSGYGLVTTAERNNFHTHSNKSVLDDITSTKVSNWDSAYSNIGKASYDANGNALATQTWVNNKGYITSSAISDMATKTWVVQQNYITSSDLSGYATQTWVNNKNYTTLAAVEAYLEDEGYATETWVTNKGYLTSISVNSSDTTIGTSLTTIATVQGTAIKAKIASYLLTSDFTAANIRDTLSTTAVNRATADASGNTITSSYLRKDTDDTMSANLTIGAQTSTSTAKKLTIYGRTSSSYPTLVIVGVANDTTRYTTNIWRDDTYLQIGSSVYMTGNLVTTGNQISGNASDRRLKDDIRDIKLDEAEEMLAALHPVSFRWNEKAGELSDGQLTGVSRGFIADELLAQMPNAGRKMWGEYDAIYYEQVIPYLVAGWQQQNLRIRILEGDMRIVRAENESLRRRLRLYEQQ